MITRLHIENFKSLVDFDLPLQPHRLGQFVCLVGMNGAGKSTVLQGLDFLATLIQGRLGDWLKRREWDGADLPSRIPRDPQWQKVEVDGRKVRRLLPWRIQQIIPFELAFDFDGEEVVWRGRFHRGQLRCTSEEIVTEIFGDVLMKHAERTLETTLEAGHTNRSETADLEYEGSILSVQNVRHPLVRKIREFMLGFKSLELLSPQAMRRRSRKGEDIGYGGEQLSAFIDSLGVESQSALLKALKEFYPALDRLTTTTSRGGWKKLMSREFQGTYCTVSSTHMNDGMLRVIAILAQAYSNHPVLLFDEIENGINSELVEKLVDFLTTMKKQVFVTTHSPMILNYLEDDKAKDSVHFLYRDDAGWTRAVRFFDLPEMEAKLKGLGPGEVFVDTNLTRLTKRLGKRNHPSPAS